MPFGRIPSVARDDFRLLLNLPRDHEMARAQHPAGNGYVCFRCDQVGPDRSGTSSAVKTPSGSTESTSVALRSFRESILAERDTRCCSYTIISLQYSMTTYRDSLFWS